MDDIFCNIFGSKTNDLPSRLIDNTTIMQKKCKKYHTTNTHLLCIILRIIISIAILNGMFSTTSIILFCIIVIIGFSIKYMFSEKNWKNYLRIILIYLTILTINLSDVKNKHILNFILIFIDAILGQQSRHYTSLLI